MTSTSSESLFRFVLTRTRYLQHAIKVANKINRAKGRRILTSKEFTESPVNVSAVLVYMKCTMMVVRMIIVVLMH